MLLIGLAPVVILLMRYQQHSPHPLRWWELPAYGAAFALYVYLWAIASLLAWVRLMRGRSAGRRRAGRAGGPAREGGDVLGTRPEVIKLAPVVSALRRDSGSREHRRLDRAAPGDARPDARAVRAPARRRPRRHAPDQRLGDLTAELVRGLGGTIAALEPTGSLVQGDTTTAFCGALAALLRGHPGRARRGRAAAGRPRAVPGGGQPRLVARLATLHFCPTRERREPARRRRARGARARDGQHGDRRAALGGRTSRAGCRLVPVHPPRRILLTLHRRESHGEAMRSVCIAVRRARRRGDTEVVFPVHRSPAVRRRASRARRCGGRARLRAARLPLARQLLDSSDLVLTDSGGLQEEAPGTRKAGARPARHDRATRGGRRRRRAAGRHGSEGDRRRRPRSCSTIRSRTRPWRVQSPFGDGRARARDRRRARTSGTPAEQAA